GTHAVAAAAARAVVLGRDAGLARLAAHDLLARPPGHPLARRVEAHDAPLAVEDADERLRGVDERGADLVVDRPPRDVRCVVVVDGASRAGPNPQGRAPFPVRATC